MASFTYFGEEFAYVEPEDFPSFDFAEFCEAVADGEDEFSPRSTGIALRVAVGSVAEADRKRFRDVSRRNRAKARDWMAVIWGFMAGASERPTGLPADSSAGQSDTPVSSGSQPIASVTSLTEREPEARPVRADLALAAARSRPA